MIKVRDVVYRGEKWSIYDTPGSRKQRIAIRQTDGKKVRYGDPNMKEYPGTKRGDNYCTRSEGIGKKYNIIGNPLSPNFWSRRDLWKCKGSKSLKRRVL